MNKIPVEYNNVIVGYQEEGKTTIEFLDSEEARNVIKMLNYQPPAYVSSRKLNTNESKIDFFDITVKSMETAFNGPEIKTLKYEIQKVNDNYRITHIKTDSRIATCYLKYNADLVCDALNNLIDSSKAELLEENIWSIHKYLDGFDIPRKDKDQNEYSIIGRIAILNNK